MISKLVRFWANHMRKASYMFVRKEIKQSIFGRTMITARLLFPAIGRWTVFPVVEFSRLIYDMESCDSLQSPANHHLMRHRNQMSWDSSSFHNVESIRFDSKPEIDYRHMRHCWHRKQLPKKLFFQNFFVFAWMWVCIPELRYSGVIP